MEESERVKEDSKSSESPHTLSEKDIPLNIETSSESFERALRIMDSVLKALEARGYKIKVSTNYRGNITWVYCGDVQVGVKISLKERYSKIERELTAEEKRKPPYLIDNRFITAASGKLVFALEKGYEERKWWIDKKEEPLEKRLNEILASVRANLESLRLVELERLEEIRRKEEAKIRREEELARREKLERDVATWAKAERIRAYLKTYEEKLLEKQGEIVQGSTEDLYLRWAFSYADSLDPLLSSSDIE